MHASLQVADDRGQDTLREKPGRERPSLVRPQGRQLTKSNSNGVRHVLELPGNLVLDRRGTVGIGKTNRFRGVRGSTQRMCAHVRDRCRLPGSSRGCRGWSANAARCRLSGEPLGNALRGSQLASSEGAGPDDRLAWSIVLRGFGLEDPQDAFGAIGGPRRHDSTVTFAQSLRRGHVGIVSQGCHRILGTVRCPGGSVRDPRWRTVIG